MESPFEDGMRSPLETENDRLRAQLVQISGQVAIADDGNWRDVIEKIGHIADGRTSPSA